MSFKDSFYKYSKDSRLVGASAVVIKDDDIVEEVSYGYKSLENKSPVTADTIFRIASISKIIVSIAALTLIEQGKAALDDDIGDILGFKIRNPHHLDKKITIKMLMTQTSSITDAYDDEDPKHDKEIRGYNGVNGTSWDVGLEELLVPNDGKYYTDLTWNKEEPGTKFIYSNFGCGILACIVEALSGELFTKYVERVILKPLNMDASFRASDIVRKDEIANLYYQTNDENNLYKISRSAESFINSGYPIFDLKENYRGPAGGLFTSMKDLSKIMRLLLNDGVCEGDRILKKETVDIMLQLHWYGEGFNYDAKGLQLKFIDCFDTKLFKGHTGSAYGVISYLFFNREEQLGICFITNGGYYKLSKDGFYDVEENVFNAFLKEYWPKVEKEMIFEFDIEEDYGTLDDRVIYFEQKPILKGDDVYLPINAIGSGLNAIPRFENNRLKILKKGNISRTDYIVDNDIIFVNINEIISNLKLKYIRKDNNIIIKY